jgi:NAD(P)-dependent dehydrogenase (short-subunit alcohol dehydrogenase family)
MLPKFVGEELDMEDLEESVPMGVIAQPKDMAHTAAFVASDDARLVTGQVINVGGGRSL